VLTAILFAVLFSNADFRDMMNESYDTNY